MKLPILIFVALIFFNCNSKQNNNIEPVSIEFRLAETKYMEGLSEYTFRNTNKRFYLHPQLLSDNKDLLNASIVELENEYAVEVKFTKSGTQKWTEITRNSIGKHIAILVNDKLVTCPLVRAKIDQGLAIITGNFSKKEAENISRGLLRK